MNSRRNFFRMVFLPILLAGTGLAVPSSAHSGTLDFSPPKRLAVLPWAGPSQSGVPAKGAEGLVADSQGRILLQNGPTLAVYSALGRYLGTWSPMGSPNDFFGFAAMDVGSGGKLLLLARLESPVEQSNKDNFEERSKPGAQLLVLDKEGKLIADKEYRDEEQPHSFYFLYKEAVYSLHDDGSYRNLDSPASAPDSRLEDFARTTRTPAVWLEHVKKLPVYRTSDRIYHDIQGGVHTIPAAVAYLMGRPLVEGIGPLGLRKSRTYYQVLCNKKDFLPAVFVEDFWARQYGLVELIPPDGDLDASPGYTVYVDAKGNVIEGVAKKNGYEIYEWKLLN